MACHNYLRNIVKLKHKLVTQAFYKNVTSPCDVALIPLFLGAVIEKSVA